VLLTLKNDKDILILPADNGNATVVMSTEDCHNKIKAVLSELVYMKLKKDPTSTIERRTF
jgi:hypothetical protein